MMGEGFTALEQQVDRLLAAYQALLVENAGLRVRESELLEEVRRLGEARRVLDAGFARMGTPAPSQSDARRALLAGLDAALARLDALLEAVPPAVPPTVSPAVASVISSAVPPIEPAAAENHAGGFAQTTLQPEGQPVPFDIGRLERVPREVLSGAPEEALQDGRLF
jgi:hypothetical protein